MQGVALGGRISRVELAVLCALTLLGLPLRHASLDFLLPAAMEADGGVLVRQVELMEDDPGDPWREECWSYYPHLVAVATSLFTDAAPKPSAQAGVDAHLDAAKDVHLRVRAVVSWLSLALVPATWWIARRFVSRRAALFAAAAIALSQLVLCFGQEARPHAPAAAFAALAVVCALRLRARPDMGSYLLAGLAAAAAVGTLQSGIAVLFPLVAAHLLRDRARSVRGWRLLLALAACVLPIAIAVATLYPFRLEPGVEASEITVQPDGSVRFFGHLVLLDRFHGRGFRNVWGTLVSFEPALLVLALAGFGAWLVAFVRGPRRRSPELLVVLAYCVPYLLVIGLYERTYERFVIQLLPGIACIAAWGLDRWWSSPSRARQVLASALALTALCLSSACAVRLVQLRQLPDTSTRAAEWIADNVASDARIALVPYIDLPLLRTRDALNNLVGVGSDTRLTVLSPWMRYQLGNRKHLPAGPRFDLYTPRIGRRKGRDAMLADPVETLRATGARWAVMPAVEGDWPVHGAVHRALLEGAVLAACFPDEPEFERVGAASDPRPPPLDAGDTCTWWRRNWTWGLLSGDATVGKVLHVFRLADA